MAVADNYPCLEIGGVFPQALGMNRVNTGSFQERSRKVVASFGYLVPEASNWSQDLLLTLRTTLLFSHVGWLLTASLGCRKSSIYCSFVKVTVHPLVSRTSISAAFPQICFRSYSFYFNLQHAVLETLKSGHLSTRLPVTPVLVV